VKCAKANRPGPRAEVVRGPDLEEVRGRALVVALSELRQAGGVVELALRALARGSRFLLRGAVLGGAGGERLERRVRLVDIRRDVRVLASTRRTRRSRHAKFMSSTCWLVVQNSRDFVWCRMAVV
jgi:hypothetical protein